MIIEKEKGLMTAGISMNQIISVESLPIWGDKKPTMDEMDAYIMGLIHSRLTALLGDDGSGNQSQDPSIDSYTTSITKKYTDKLYQALKDGEIKRMTIEDRICDAVIENTNIVYRLGYYQALMDRGMYFIGG